MPPKLTPEIIRAAIDGFENQKRRIDTQIAELRGLLDGNAPATGTSPEAVLPRKRRKFSAAAIKRMREAQKRRWAKVTGEAEPEPATTAEPAKPMRRLSAAGRRAIAEATKKRWAAVRAAKAAASTKTAPARKTTAKAKKAAPMKDRAKKTAPAAASAAGQNA